MPEKEKLIESAEIRTYTTKDGEEIIRDVVLKNVMFNYTFVTAPKPKEMKGDGETYETNVIIREQETWDVFAEAFNKVYQRAVTNSWRGKTPELSNMNVPFYVPQRGDDGEYYPLEENAVAVLKTKNKQQPELFLRQDGPLRVAAEEDVNEFYSGMVGDAVISFWAYDVGNSPRPGIMLFINGVCKVAKGEPITFVGDNYDFVGAFSDGEDAASAFAETKAEPTVAPGLGDLLGKKTETPSAPASAPKTAKNILKPSEDVKPITGKVEEAPADLLKTLMKGNK